MTERLLLLAPEDVVGPFVKYFSMAGLRGTSAPCVCPEAETTFISESMEEVRCLCLFSAAFDAFLYYESVNRESNPYLAI